ncbi:MAG: hypothetical protein AAF710_09490 [Planctomycetota bacterium]
MAILGSMIVQALGSTGLFASRAFVPAFAAALILRFGPQYPWLQDLGLLQALGFTGAPNWFTSDLSLIVLGVLAAAEIGATKNADARALLNAVDKYAKPAMAALTLMGVFTASDVDFTEQNVLPPGTPGSAAAAAVVVPVAAGVGGVTLASVFASLTAALTFVVASARSAIVGLFIDADEDDDVGVQKLMAWGEDLWSLFGFWLLILFPLVMLALIGLASGLVLLLRWWAHRKEEASRVPCGTCGKLMYRCALVCGHCTAANPNVCDLGWLGQSDTDDPADLKTHAFRLAGHRRCPTCAAKLKERRPHQTCEVCGGDPFGDPAFARAYVNHIAKRLPGVLLLSAALGAVWVVGVIPAVIIYRLTLVAPLRRYIPRGRNFLTKWSLRIVFFILLATNIVPGAGIITVPVMALLSFLTYRGVFEAMLNDQPAEAPQPATPLPAPA